jgi:hypothetical protein
VLGLELERRQRLDGCERRAAGRQYQDAGADTAKQLPHVSSLESVVTLVTSLLSFGPLAGRIKPVALKNRTQSLISSGGPTCVQRS